MAAGDVGSPKRYYSAVAVETSLVASIAAASAGSTTTSVVVASVSGFPTSVPYTLIIDPDTTKEEVVTVTATSGTTLTMVRGEDGTAGGAGIAHTAGAVVRHGVSAREFKQLQTHISARGYDTDSAMMSDTHVHGLASGDGSVVGTDASQTLTRKTLTAPTVNAATLTGTVTSTATITGGTMNPTTLTQASVPVVTTTSTSTLTNKTLTSPTINGGTVSSATVTSATIVSGTLSTDLAAGGFKVSGLATPTATADAATKGYVDTAVANLVASAPAALDTLNELAAAIGNDASFSTTITNSIATKLPKAGGTMTGAIDMGSSKITSLGTPTASTDAVTKGYIDTLYGSTVAAATSATSAAASATAAATSATSAAASATAAATSATSAAVSATAAVTSANSASASATTASNSAATAQTSATSAAASQSAASASQTAAATSATSAAASATAAATSATSAATSATSSATTYNTYKTWYLGTFAAAPTLDNQGNALINGATYFNSSTSTMYVYNGSTWSAISSATSYSAPIIGSTTINSGTTYGTITGLNLTSGTVTADPTTALGIASKQYVDAVTAAINFHAPVQRASTANLTGTYNNGTSGVGATFTLTATGRLAIDGGNVSTNDRVLLKNQTTDLQNGIYVVTNQGGPGVSAILTRASDYDTPAEITNGDVVFTIAGTQNTGVTFVNTMTASPTVVGTSSITFSTYTSASLPSQTGNSGYLLTTDGTTPSWTNSVTNLSLTTPTIAGATISGTVTSTATITGGTLSGNTHTNATLTGTLTAGATSGTNGYYLQTTGTGVQWAAVAGYSAPTIGSTSIGSGATVTTINGLTKLVSAKYTSLDGASREVDIALMQIMGAY